MLSDNLFPYYKNRTRHKRRGATLVEFAFVLPILLVILMGIMEFGLLAYSNLMLANAVREGARSASLGATPATIRTRIKNATKYFKLTDNEIILTSSSDNGVSYPYSLVANTTTGRNNAKAGDLINVAISTKHKSITKFIPVISNFQHNVNVVVRREATE